MSNFSAMLDQTDAVSYGDPKKSRVKLSVLWLEKHLIYTKAVIVQLFESRANEVKTVVVTDSKNLEEAIKSTSLVDDPWLVSDIAVIKEAVEKGIITKVKRVRGDDMLANCLTMSEASGTDLVAVLESGYFK